MVSAMIDECMWENVKSKNENLFPNDFFKLSTKHRKRIRDVYNEIEYGYKKERNENGRI